MLLIIYCFTPLLTFSFLFRSIKKSFPLPLLERMTKCVPTVTKSLNILHTWGSIFQPTLEKNPIFAQNVGEALPDAAAFISIRESLASKLLFLSIVHQREKKLFLYHFRNSQCKTNIGFRSNINSLTQNDHYYGLNICTIPVTLKN